MEPATRLAGTPTARDRPISRIDDPLPLVRLAVRELLVQSPAYRAMSQTRRREMAESMVHVCHAAAALVREEIESDAALDRTRAESSTAPLEVEPPRAVPPSQPTASPALPQGRRAEGVSPPSLRAQALAPAELPQGTRRAIVVRSPSADALPHRPVATAQSAGGAFSGGATERLAETTRRVLNAVSFPRFVTELINGVFKAMVDSSMQQMNAYVELLNNVAASTEGFTDANMGPDRARQWLAERYPGSFEVTPADADSDEPRGQFKLALRDGATPPSQEALRTDLGLGETESAPTGDPERSLVPLARRALAQQRQQTLATLVMLGMQRIVIESGRINAAMRFHIDTRSAAQADEGSSFDTRTSVEAGGSYGVGPWGVRAGISSTIGFVSTQSTQTTEEMNTDLDLNSSVELYFKTDYLPLDRIAAADKVDRIRVKTLNPEAELKAAAEGRAARRASGDTATRPPPTTVEAQPRSPAQAPRPTPPPNQTPDAGASRAASPNPPATQAPSPRPAHG